MKKNLFVLILACLLLLTLAACGEKEETAQQTITAVMTESAENAASNDPADSSAQAEQPGEPAEQPENNPEQPAETTEQVPEETETAEEAVAPAGPTVDDALAFVDQDVSELVAAIGEPLSSSYEYSCSGPGDDGIWSYDGFIVFTYREPDGSAEVVVDAEAE